MNVTEAIRSRRSIRSFKKQKIESEKLQAILEAARLAPSARNEQEWLFIVIRHPETLKKLAFACEDQLHIAEADTAICCCLADNPDPNDLSRILRYEDVAVANAFMMLQATELGIGSCWIGSFNDKKLRTMLRIPDNLTIHSLMALGYPHYIPGPTERKALSEICRSEDFTRSFEI